MCVCERVHTHSRSYKLGIHYHSERFDKVIPCEVLCEQIICGQRHTLTHDMWQGKMHRNVEIHRVYSCVLCEAIHARIPVIMLSYTRLFWFCRSIAVFFFSRSAAAAAAQITDRTMLKKALLLYEHAHEHTFGRSKCEDIGRYADKHMYPKHQSVAGTMHGHWIHNACVASH